ncbi:hypothetical protein [Micromonospora sp. WMMD980]|uniref:hypothetical protein n=1 Tax=Micromonospora sp. WMMD980 TaxID=3016088 RepID=UPI002415D3B2|nr:hypothetical protein [Micromonospora sp. WMMD980]MDG4803195.1 hypothetical protein [Micromonospora sp. WMMD980]
MTYLALRDLTATLLYAIGFYRLFIARAAKPINQKGLNMNVRRMLGIAGVSVMAGMGAVVLDGAPALAETCPKTRDVYIPGGESHYTISCSGGSVYVDGRVKDTKSDGKCVQVKALINGSWNYSEKACPSGTTKYFSWSGPGNAAEVYTYTV